MDSNLIKMKALEFAEKLFVKNFIANDGWLSMFKERNNLVDKFYGEVEDANEESKNSFLSLWSDMKQRYEDKDIRNANETRLLFRLLPDATYAYSNEKVSGGKKQKKRIAVLFCVSMLREKKEPFVFSNLRKPRCFKNVQHLPDRYKHSSNA